MTHDYQAALDALERFKAKRSFDDYIIIRHALSGQVPYEVVEQLVSALNGLLSNPPKYFSLGEVAQGLKTPYELAEDKGMEALSAFEKYRRKG